METPIDLHEALAPVAFKYCDDRGVDILRNLRLKVTPPLYFNDPFEFTPQVVATNPERKIDWLVNNEEQIHEMYLDQVSAGYKGDKSRFRKDLKAYIPDLLNAVEANLPRLIKSLQDKMLEHYSKESGVLCLSKRADSLLMWGHYASSHQGLVVGFDRAWKWFMAGPKGLREVQYERERVVLDTSLHPGGEEEYRNAEKVVFNKNVDWEYEQELRQVFRLESLPKERGESGEFYYLPMPASVVKCVILGLRTPSALVEEVGAILDSDAFSHVSLWKAELHRSQFALNFQCIKQGRAASERKAEA